MSVFIGYWILVVISHCGVNEFEVKIPEKIPAYLILILFPSFYGGPVFALFFLIELYWCP